MALFLWRATFSVLDAALCMDGFKNLVAVLLWRTRMLSMLGMSSTDRDSGHRRIIAALEVS